MENIRASFSLFSFEATHKLFCIFPHRGSFSAHWAPRATGWFTNYIAPDLVDSTELTPTALCNASGSPVVTDIINQDKPRSLLFPISANSRCTMSASSSAMATNGRGTAHLLQTWRTKVRSDIMPIPPIVLKNPAQDIGSRVSAGCGSCFSSEEGQNRTFAASWLEDAFCN